MRGNYTNSKCDSVLEVSVAHKQLLNHLREGLQTTIGPLHTAWAVVVCNILSCQTLYLNIYQQQQ